MHPTGEAGRNIRTPRAACAEASAPKLPGTLMLNRLLFAIACLAAAAAAPSAQSDLDALMARVLERRDDNWKKLQQYTLNERESLQITALAVFRLFGYEREYLWYPREGFFIRSPLKADGVTIAEDKRREEEDRWLRRAKSREGRLAARNERGARDSGDASSKQLPGDIVMTGAVEDVILQSFEPDFIRSAKFMRFKFDRGQYALAGREKMLDRDVLKIEYYPTNLFDDDKERADRADRTDRQRTAEQQREDKREEDFEASMNKVSLVTLWVDPAEHQILRYEFRIQDMDFLPGSALVRVTGTRATMQMGEPFPNVWLPDSVGMRFRLTSAAGPLEAKYEVDYRDYRLPTTSGRIR
jgi:hypothetical protein